MLHIDNLSKTFYPGTPNEKKAVSGLSLDLRPGEFITVIGGNGAGKSTLLNLIAGSVLPDSGCIELAEKNITYLPEYKRARMVGRLFQDPLMGTAPNMTIEENMALAYLRGKKKRFAKGVDEKDRIFFKEKLSLLQLGLEDRLKSKMGLLSGGQRQAITLLMATLSTPKLLLLDEHTAALDPATAAKVLELTTKIVREDRITTIMITHNITSSLECGSRTVMMEQGSILLDLVGDQRKKMTVEDILKLFKAKSKKELDNDRMLLS